MLSLESALHNFGEVHYTSRNLGYVVKLTAPIAEGSHAEGMANKLQTDPRPLTIHPQRTHARRRALAGKPTLRLTADLRCMICGHFLGEVVVNRMGRSATILDFTPGPQFEGSRATPNHCDKCGGALGLDEVKALWRSSRRLAPALGRGA